MIRDLRFCVADLEVSVAITQRDAAPRILGSYEHHPSSGAAPLLQLELERRAGFADDREPGRSHPGFDVQPAAGRILVLSRWDAEGTLELPAAADQPVRGRFRLSDNPHSTEAVIRTAISIALPRRGGLILHASAVADRAGRALLFAGPSGAGKSTIADILAREPWRCPKLSDELVIVARSDAGWRAHVTPFIGSTGLQPGESASIRGIHFLKQGSAHERAERTDHGATLDRLMSNVLAYVAEVTTASAVLDLATRLATDVRAYELRFAKDTDVGKVLDITC